MRRSQILSAFHFCRHLLHFFVSLSSNTGVHYQAVAYSKLGCMSSQLEHAHTHSCACAAARRSRRPTTHARAACTPVCHSRTPVPLPPPQPGCQAAKVRDCCSNTLFERLCNSSQENIWSNSFCILELLYQKLVSNQLWLIIVTTWGHSCEPIFIIACVFNITFYDYKLLPENFCS